MFRRTVFYMALALTTLCVTATATGIERIELRVEGMT